MESLALVATSHRSCLATPGNPAALATHQTACLAAAHAFAELPPSPTTTTAAWDLALTLAATPATLADSPPALLAAAPLALADHRTGLLRAALLVRPWELPAQSWLADLPGAAWAPAVRWLLATPASPLPPATLARLAAHQVLVVTALATWAERNLGSAAVRAGIDAFLALPPPDLAHWPIPSTEAWQRARARLVTRALRPTTPPPVVALRSCRGRALRLALVGDSPSPDFASLLPPEHFTIVHPLPDHTPATPLSRALQTAQPDILLFTTEPARWDHELLALAATRHAPVQLALGTTPTGFETIDATLIPRDHPAAAPASPERWVPLALASLTVAPDSPTAAPDPDQPDELALADAVAHALTHVFEAILTHGPKHFRLPGTPRDPTPSPTAAAQAHDAARDALAAHDAPAAYRHAILALAAAPADAELRHLLGLALLEMAHPARAVLYLTRALAGYEHDGARWFALARALHAANQPGNAIDALSGCLRAQPDHLDAWLLLTELAHAAGSTEIAAEALDVAQTIDPSDPRIATWRLRLQPTAADPFAAFAADPFAAALASR